MIFLDQNQAQGDIFVLNRTHEAHFAGRRDLDALVSGAEPQRSAVVSEFNSLLQDAIETQDTSLIEASMQGVEEVNRLQLESDALALQAIIDPDSVDAHDVSIAAAKAQMSLQTTKTIVDQVLQAYRSIISIR